MFHAEGIVSGTLGDTVNFCSVEPNAFCRIVDLAYRTQQACYHNIGDIVRSYSVTANVAAYFFVVLLFIYLACWFANFHVQITFPCCLPEG